MRRFLSSAVFLLVLFSIAAPWMSLSAGCGGPYGEADGAELLTGSEVDLRSFDGTVFQTVRVDADPLVSIIVAVALVGAASALFKGDAAGKLPYVLTALLSLLGILYVCAYMARAQGGVLIAHGRLSFLTLETGAEWGSFLALYAFVLAGLLNLTIPVWFPTRRIVARQGATGPPGIEPDAWAPGPAPMIDALGGLGWGVGVIGAEVVDLVAIVDARRLATERMSRGAYAPPSGARPGDYASGRQTAVAVDKGAALAPVALRESYSTAGFICSAICLAVFAAVLAVPLALFTLVARSG